MIIHFEVDTLLCIVLEELKKKLGLLGQAGRCH